MVTVGFVTGVLAMYGLRTCVEDGLNPVVAVLLLILMLGLALIVDGSNGARKV